MIKNIILTLFFCVFVQTLAAQNSVTVKVISKDHQETVVGASVYIKNTTKGSTTNLEGIATIDNIENGKHILVISFVGFETFEKAYTFPLENNTITIELHEDESTLDTVEISSTRSKRTIAQIPTRVEVISGEELGEKAVMNSANIAMLLRESTGIQMQQTSATSANQSIRIQGLDGRFTQLLKDGFPLFGGFSSGLSIMQIPPLDLKQVEIIKGSSSTLYGAGAIAGLVNLITKQPKLEREIMFMLDKTSRDGSTVNVYYSKRDSKFGLSFYGSGNLQKATDVNNDKFSDIPKVQSINLNPSLYFYPTENEKWKIGLNVSFEDRKGGDIDVVNENPNPSSNFFEENISNRLGLQITYKNEISEDKSFSFKNSLSYFKRDLKLVNYEFLGNQFATFTEATYNLNKDESDWVFGANLITEKFSETPFSTLDRSYQQETFGGFVQSNWNLEENITLETGLRTDYVSDYGLFFLPRISLFVKYNESVSSRFGGGFGYKIPSIFTEESEKLAFQNVLAIDPNNFKAENSFGVNADVNYKTSILNDNVSVSFNQLFFYTRLKNTLLLEQKGTDYEFVNSSDPLNSFGFETNLKLKYKDFILFTNYAFNNVKINNQQKVLTPKHSFGGVLMYEVHDKWRIGYEAYYKSSQFRNDLSKTPNFWTMGLMAMRTFNTISLYANFENFTDTKQSNYESMVKAPHNNPSLTDLWAPTDGFVFNAGILIKL
ncbi:TonB-dependent receptor [Polaribacter uvawellassae]|uniref:TonB-dependent receptor n=1 Tax=Polaribacter uvawellassae TaxID=3133495 RepID=UPI003219CCD1